MPNFDCSLCARKRGVTCGPSQVPRTQLKKERAMKSTSNGHADPNRQVEGGLGRREFLVLTSSCAAATVAFGPNVFGDVFAAPRDLAVGAVSIDDIDARLTDASKINSADASFLRNAAKVTLAGIALADQEQRSIG